jgi:CMP-N-acetylneuraminic acid synthetase
MLGGKPLLQWTLDCAKDAELLDRLVVSTDDDAIAEAAKEFGGEVPFRRPTGLATDDAPMVDVVIHALLELSQHGYQPDCIALLQPTSPLRRPSHIHSACDLLKGNDSVCSVVKLSPELSPHYVMRIDEDGFLRHFLQDGDNYTRRQDVPSAYTRDGTIYLFRKELVLKDRSIYGDRCLPMTVDPRDSLSIDYQEDWEEAERRLISRTNAVRDHKH